MSKIFQIEKALLTLYANIVQSCLGPGCCIIFVNIFVFPLQGIFQSHNVAWYVA